MKPASSTLLLASFAISSGAYAAVYAGSGRFRNGVKRLDPRMLALAQTARLAGAFLFTRQTLRRRIPGRYGFTTAASDFLAGASAPFAAARLSGSRLKLWHAAGIVGLAVSGGLGVLTAPTRAGVLARGKTSQATASMPLVLVPLVFGPAVLIAHLMALTAAGGKAASSTR